MSDVISKIKQLIREEIQKEVAPPEVSGTYQPDPNKYKREGSMARSQLMKTAKYSVDLIEMFDDMTDLPEWVESKITRASDYIGMVKHYLEGEIARTSGALQERSLSKKEEGDKEDIVKGMKKSKKDFEKRYGKDAESVMYATATKLAKEKK